MVLDIALGIVLAVFILAALPAILVAAGYFVLVLLGLGLIALVWAAYSSTSADDLLFFGMIGLFVLSLVGLARIGDRLEKRTQQKVLTAEFMGLTIFGISSMALFALTLWDWVGLGDPEHLSSHLSGVAFSMLPVCVIGWRVLRRFRELNAPST